MASANWPPALKTFVNETFSKCTDTNREAVEKELKELIFKAFQENKLNSTDWKSVNLATLNPPKKRKAFVASTPHSYGVTNPSNGTDESDRRDKRARRFVAQVGPSGSPGGSSALGGMGGRFGGYGASATPEPEGIYDPNVLDWDNQTIVGTSTKLEKALLATNISTIRPLPILQKTLELLKKKWKTESNYGYICDQFKSMRQDLTVQRIKNDFTCTVYEIHARIALEKGDLGEFNQCQGQLRHLFSVGLSGHVMEFLGYRILYLLFSRNRAELNATIGALTDVERNDESVKHALAVRQAVSQGNYTRFFRLFCNAPKMGAYLMDHFVPRERVQALVTMTKAYQSLPVSLIISQLVFDTVEEVDAFLAEYDAATYKTAPPSTPLLNRALDCRLAQPKLVAALSNFQKVDLKGQI